MVVKRSSGTSGQSVLFRNCEEAWRAPDGQTGSNAQLIVDLRCSTKVETILFKNLAEGRGIKDFSIYLSNAEDGPWTLMMNGTLEQETNQVTFSKKCFHD